jgi:hypothetical protein
MCAAFLSGVWWVFPLIGFVICAGFMLVAFRYGRGGRGWMCMSGSRGATNDVAQPAPGISPASR